MNANGAARLTERSARAQGRPTRRKEQTMPRRLRLALPLTVMALWLGSATPAEAIIINYRTLTDDIQGLAPPVLPAGQGQRGDGSHRPWRLLPRRQDPGGAGRRTGGQRQCRNRRPEPDRRPLHPHAGG